MPDAATEPTADPTEALTADPTAHREASDDARLIRRVRWRLVAWSGGSTLLVLLVLSVALYVSVAQSLAASSIATLDSRAGEIVTQISGQPPTPGGGAPDFTFGGATFGIIITPAGSVYGPRQFALPAGLPDDAGMTSAAAASDGRDVRERSLAFPQPGGDADSAAMPPVPVRQLTVAVATPSGRYFVQIIQDRTTEAGTLQNILIVLVGGSIVVVLVAIAFGAMYARRALVPIRDSLASQRVALQRQRDFAADASHELRTPLTVIRASVEHLRRHADEPVAAVGDALEDIDAEVTHLTAMVGDLLLLARSDSGAISLERAPVEVDDIATEAATSLRGPAEARAVRLVVDPEPAAVLGDPVRLRQLVTVLIDNAIRHSPPGGEVRIEVRRAGDAVHVSVEDRGRGIRPEDLTRIFDRFWRAPDAPSGGTGLGLAIAKWIAERHDGRIVASNRDGGGARFDVELPARPASAAVPGAAPGHSPIG